MQEMFGISPFDTIGRHPWEHYRFLYRPKCQAVAEFKQVSISLYVEIY
jgi:hypothetical protein